MNVHMSCNAVSVDVVHAMDPKVKECCCDSDHTAASLYRRGRHAKIMVQGASRTKSVCRTGLTILGAGEMPEARAS